MVVVVVVVLGAEVGGKSRVFTTGVFVFNSSPRDVCTTVPVGGSFGRAHAPCGRWLRVERFTTLSGVPGFGKSTSKPSSVPQLSSRFATKMSG